MKVGELRKLLESMTSKDPKEQARIDDLDIVIHSRTNERYQTAKTAEVTKDRVYSRSKQLFEMFLITT